MPDPINMAEVRRDIELSNIGNSMPSESEMFGTWADTTAELGLPFYGDAKDGIVLFDKKASKLDRSIAGGSLIIGLGALPNVGPAVRKILKFLRKTEKAVDKGSDGAKVILRNMDEGIETITEAGKKSSKVDVKPDIKLDDVKKKADFIGTEKGTIIDTKKDYNLVDSEIPTDKGGDWYQIHNTHTDAKVKNNPHSHYPERHKMNTNRKIKETNAADLDNADKLVKEKKLRERSSRKDKGGAK